MGDYFAPLGPPLFPWDPMAQTHRQTDRATLWLNRPSGADSVKTSIFCRKVFQLQRDSSVTLHVRKKINFRGETDNNFHISQTFAPKNLSWVIWSYKYLTYWFLKDFHEKSAQTHLSKVMRVSISKGIKHLNTVLSRLVLWQRRVSLKHAFFTWVSQKLLSSYDISA